MDYIPNDLANQLLEEREISVSGIGEVFAVFISMVMTMVAVVFALEFPNLQSCPKCPFMRGSGMKNHTIDFYKCETQRDFLENMWSPFYWSLMSTMLAGCSIVVGQIASPVVMRLIKHTFIAAMASLLWYITEFQYHFDSVSRISAYYKAIFAVYLLIFTLVVVVVFCPSRVIKSFISFMGMALLIHLGLSGYNLFCGRMTHLLSAFLALYFFFVSKLAIKQEVPSHISLAMCLLVLPPVCPMVVLLICWCFDVFWTDLSDMVTTPRESPAPPLIRTLADTNIYDGQSLRNGYRLPSTHTVRNFR